MEARAIGAERIGDLDRQLAGRREDERPRAARPVCGARLRELVEDGQREGRRLAGAGLGDAQHVPAGEKLWNGALLNRRRNDVIIGDQGTLDRFGQAEIRETTVCHLSILLRFTAGGALGAAGPKRTTLSRARPRRVGSC
jgi:hypothetical protein